MNLPTNLPTDLSANDQTKKQTNLGIAMAIIGFVLVGGALVLIPRLVDKKAQSLVAQNSSAKSDPGPPESRNGAAETPSKTTEESAPKTSSGKQVAANAASTTPKQASSEPTVATTPAAAPSATGPWKLTLIEKFTPDDASTKMLQTIITTIKNSKTGTLKIVGMNNINKSSKLAQIGANKIAATIAKEAQVKAHRLDVSSLQQPDLSNIIVKITFVGGEQ